jgi:hypothetical protein
LSFRFCLVASFTNAASLAGGMPTRLTAEKPLQTKANQERRSFFSGRGENFWHKSLCQRRELLARVAQLEANALFDGGSV